MGAIPLLIRGIFQKLRVLGLCMPMTNFPGFPDASVESAITAAMTAPTNPMPTTTTICRFCARCSAARVSQALKFAVVILFGGETKSFSIGAY